MNATYTAEIRTFIDAFGWKAVHAHPIYGPLIAAQRAESRRYTNDLDR